jgi:cation diffusion facilitator CzcD-associated flavoprotein CzcO
MDTEDRKDPGAEPNARKTFDIIIVGAGISGINSAYRVQTQAPNKSFTVLEARDNLGGTWDFFKYPGIRSDSDLHTFGFPWRPWPGAKAIADAASIRRYLRDSADSFGFDKYVRYGHKLLSADWSSKTQQWNFVVGVGGERQTFRAKFIICSTGYYNYDQPLETKIPGLENFQGQVVHPQFWPDDLDYAGKKMAIIGSGATTITLLPCLAEKAEKVTMVQRSPAYILPLPGNDTSGAWLRYILPLWIVQRLVRLKFLTVPFLFFKFCSTFPRAAKRILRVVTKRQLPKHIPWDPHFNPKYYPWEQRMCICPDADFFKALRSGKCDVVTGHIEGVREHEISIEGQPSVPADIIVTATGLQIQLAGGAAISVDGTRFHPSEKFLWNGLMLQDLPNASFIIGYTNASWTLGADATAQMTTRILNWMDKTGFTVAVPRVNEEDAKSMETRPTLNLSSTYVKAAVKDMPKCGSKKPWLQRSSYWSDMYNVKYGSLTEGMEYLSEVATL